MCVVLKTKKVCCSNTPYLRVYALVTRAFKKLVAGISLTGRETKKLSQAITRVKDALTDSQLKSLKQSSIRSYLS